MLLGAEVSAAFAILTSAITGREGCGAYVRVCSVITDMSCEYGKQRGYDYDYNRSSVDERAAEDRYLGHGAIHMHDRQYTRNGADERVIEGWYLGHGTIHTPRTESKDHQPKRPHGEKEPLRHRRGLLLSMRLAAPGEPRPLLSRSRGNSGSTGCSTTDLVGLLCGHVGKSVAQARGRQGV